MKQIKNCLSRLMLKFFDQLLKTALIFINNFELAIIILILSHLKILL